MYSTPHVFDPILCTSIITLLLPTLILNFLLSHTLPNSLLIGGNQKCTAYSRCGRTRDVYNGRIISLFLYLKLRATNPNSILFGTVFLALIPVKILFSQYLNNNNRERNHSSLKTLLYRTVSRKLSNANDMHIVHEKRASQSFNYAVIKNSSSPTFI